MSRKMPARAHRTPAAVHSPTSPTPNQSTQSRIRNVARQTFRKTPTEESKQYVIRFARKKAFFRVGDTRKTYLAFAGHLLMRACYPENALPIQALVRIPVPIGKQEVPLLGIVSHIVRGRAETYKRHHDQYYRQARDSSVEIEKSHRIHVDREVRPLIRKMKEESGIIPNQHSTNIGISHNKAIFFEIAGIDTQTLREFARKKGITVETILTGVRIPNRADRQKVVGVLNTILFTSHEKTISLE